MSALDNFKRESIDLYVKKVMGDVNCDRLEAIKKMQAVCVQTKNDSMLECLIEYKNELIDQGVFS